ncbi:hypothetical protein [Chryseobacterium culicis]|uniref:hypothetical protein n=1 Tax=Chryseobacterium culicis TaxID=680127 RepID=UPI0018757B3D|nr:hypothetical protein [Chryseobacterium culicis]MBE4949914.1 hypothetical protein [Chryseobacterium culicis]
MIVELWVDGASVDLYENTNIKHTLQINDVAEVKDRQASYTNSFKIPKSAKNVRLFGGLGIHSSTSNIPYIKPDALLKIEGFDFLTQAWVQVTSTDEEYSVNIYSGIIEFFKKFENKTIGDELAADLTEINHNKNLSTVIATQNDDTLKYAYLFADFNGRTHRKSNSNVVNIDFVVPSVLVSYLFDKIHSKAGYTFTGEFLTYEDYTNLWISYPKAPEDDGSTVYFEGAKSVNFSSPGNDDSLGFTFNNSGSNGIKVQDTGVYNIQTNGIAGLNEPIPSGFGILYYEFFYKLNGGPLISIPNNSNFQISLSENDVIDFYYSVSTDWNGSISMSVSMKQTEDVLFTEEFKDLKITDLLKDVYNFFGLTPDIDNVRKTINYLLNKERFKEAATENWSNYLVSIDNETYKFGSAYGQNNLFKYKYNDQEDSQSDGSLVIQNKNLDEEKTVFTSITYSVEKELLSDFYVNSSLTQKVSIYKLYEKEPQDGSTELKYKPLSKRYFYLRMRKVNTSVVIGSDIQNLESPNSVIKFGEFRNLAMSYIIGKYYSDFLNVINQSVIWNVTLNVPYPKLLKLDMTKVLYFDQLQQYCFINKISFDDNKTTAELVRIKDFRS